MLLGAEVARLTSASAYSETRPGLAGKLAPRLPEVLVSAAMAQVGTAAAQGQAPPRSATERLHNLARAAPLSADPLLVEAAIAQRDGDFARSERLLLEARRRDPRSEAARYLLANAWLQDGRIADGLGELAILSRLMPASSVQLVPALAQYARTPGAAEQLKRIASTNPRLKQPLLNALAADPVNLQLVLDIEASVPSAANQNPASWQSRLLNALIREGAYARAHALWQHFTGVEGPRPLLFNSEFRPVAAPPPFNWAFASTGGGLAEPGNGSMRVLYYGREDVALASQLLLLPPGRYAFAAGVAGTPAPGSLVWVASCLGQRAPLMELKLGPASARQEFDVPAGGCPAQTLELRGVAQDMQQESDVRVGAVRLERVAGRAART